jgi:N-acylglucosamine-6-phosphate 2-epimerase
MSHHDIIDLLRGQLLVSCQASPGSPLDTPSMIAALARAAELGGAAGVRVCGARNIRAVRQAVSVPIIGLLKLQSPDYPVYITPTLADAVLVRRAGADIVAVDGTGRRRPEGWTVAELFAQLQVLGIRTVADVDDLDAARAAAEAGADMIATTLSGYTTALPPVDEPDVDLVTRIASVVDRPVIAEGRYRLPSQVREAFLAGAHSVVVGDAITNPTSLTRRLAMAAPAHAGAQNAEPTHDAEHHRSRSK